MQQKITLFRNVLGRFGDSKYMLFFKKRNPEKSVRIRSPDFTCPATPYGLYVNCLIIYWSFTETEQYHFTSQPAHQLFLFYLRVQLVPWISCSVFFRQMESHKEEEERQKKRQRSSLCLGGRMYSIHCRTCYFAQDDYEE